MLTTAGKYLHKAPPRADILSVFAGIRPLVKTRRGPEHRGAFARITHHIDGSGLLTIAGGKWTTYRNMAEDCVDQAATLGGTAQKTVRHADAAHSRLSMHANESGVLAGYGSDATAIQELIRSDPRLGEPLHPALPYRRRGSDLGRAAGDGADRGGRPLPPHAGAVPERAGRDRDGAARGGADGWRTASRYELDSWPNRCIYSGRQGLRC